MTVITKADRSGRSTNQLAGKRMKRALGLPEGVGWCVPLPGHVLDSPSWLLMSKVGCCPQVIGGIMSELARNGGKTNGELIVPYNDLVDRGVRRSSIRDALCVLEALGLIAVSRDGRSFGTVKQPSLYRITWCGTPDGLTPTHEWKAIKTTEEAERGLESARRRLAEPGTAHDSTGKLAQPGAARVANRQRCPSMSHN
jgi:hypothetical protein